MSRLTLPDGSHVRRESEVRRAFDLGRSAASGDVVVYAFDRADGRPSRYALVVGRKWGGAVVRNRVRRLLRESFRTARPTLPCGFDLLLLPRGKLESKKMPEVREMLARAARNAVRRVAEARRSAADAATSVTPPPAESPASGAAGSTDTAPGPRVTADAPAHRPITPPPQPPSPAAPPSPSPPTRSTPAPTPAPTTTPPPTLPPRDPSP